MLRAIQGDMYLEGRQNLSLYLSHFIFCVILKNKLGECNIPVYRLSTKSDNVIYSFCQTFKRILIIKQIRCTNFSNLFWNKILHVSDSSSLHHQELFTVHAACELSANLYDIYHCCVFSEKLLMMNRGTVRNM